MHKSIAVLIFFFLAALPARAEFPVTEDRPLAPTLGISETATVVATDAGFLTFWKTSTSWGSTGMPQVGRFSSDGELEGRSTQWELPLFSWSDAASNGDQVLLAGHCNDPSGGAFCAVRLTAEGNLLGTTLLPDVQAAGTAVASNGDGFLVVSQTSDARVLAIPVSREGIATGPIALGGWNSWEPASKWVSAAAIGDAYFAAFGPAIGHVLTRVSASGVETSVPLDPPFELAHAAIEASGEMLLVVAAPKTPTADPRMRAAIFDRDLLRKTEWLPLDGARQAAEVAPTSSGWIVATWMRGPSGATDASVIAISREGFVGQPSSVPGVTGWFVDLAARDDRAALAWTTQNGQRIPGYLSNEVGFATFDAAAAPVRAPATISLGPAPQVDPAAAHGGGATLAAWTERAPSGAFVVKARVFDAAGSPLAPAVAMPFSGADQFSPEVAWGDSSFLVIWSQATPAGTATLGARVTPDGRLLDVEEIGISGAGAYADVDWNGSAWVVVSATGQIAATRISSSGTVLDATPVPISPLPSDWGIGRSEIDCNGSACLVAWETYPPFECHFECVQPEPAIDVARIAPDLAVLDPIPLRLTNRYEDVSTLAVSWNGEAGAWLVAWSLDGRQRVSAAGLLLDPLERTDEGSRFDGAVSAIAERDGWRLAWTPDSIPVRYGATSGSDAFHGWSPTGTIMDIEERRAIAMTAEREWDPLLVAAPRSLALFLRESQISAGSPQILGQFLDQTEVVPAHIVATATRVDDATVRISWTTDVPGVTQFRILRFDGRYDINWHKVWLGPTARSFEFNLPAGRAGEFVVRAYSASGPVESNVAVLPGNRTRYVQR